ncbi:MAG: FkbM family methyltransferase [Cyclobacteriaceae bacterium]
MNYLRRKLPVTKIKIFGAGLLYRILSPFVKNPSTVDRSGIKYHLNISEGIDLSVFLFGNFQKHVFDNQFLKLSSDACVIDIGANFGVMSLRYASMIPDGKVHAFEPTLYALEKLHKNIALNPNLAERIVVNHSFVGTGQEKAEDLVAYSSWNVANQKGAIHPVHLGTAKESGDAGSISIDQYVSANNLERLDLIKIDTDGHEPEVLIGASETLKKLKPGIVFEAGLYIAEERGRDFTFYFDFFEPLGYTLYSSYSGRHLHRGNYKREVPERSTIDVIAVANVSKADRK